MTASQTKSKGQALKVSLVKPVAYLSKSYRHNSHSKYDLKVHLIWIPKYRKRVLVGKVAERVRDLLRQIAMEHEV